MTPKEKAEAIKKQLVVINQLLKKPENKLCADCKKINPTWASVNLGVFVCINCSGCHREIGVHITKIRSVNLDVWPQEVLNNFKIINNKIANKYWECKLKNFDFKSLQGDKYKLIQFIRDKYENKKWIDTKKKIDPMSLIIKGKIKKYKKLFCESEDEDEEEQSDDDDKKNKKRKNKKKKKDNDDSESEEDDDKQKKSKKKKRKDESEDNESEKKGKNKKKEDDEEEDDDDDDEEDNDDDEDEEENDNKNKKNHSKNKKDEDDDDFEEVKEKKIIESKTPITQRPQQLSNNLFLDMNTNQNNQNNLNLNFNNNNSNSSNNLSMNNNIVDIFNQQTPADKKSQDLMNNINNAYFSPQPVNSARTNNMFQQMPNNMGLNLQNRNNNLQDNNMNNYQNMGQNNIMNINHVHSTQNIHMNMNNNMFNMNMNNNMNNNMNYGMNNNFNMGGMNNINNMNNNMQNNMNNNMNINNNNNNLKSTSSSTIPSNIPSFNMEYFNQNLTGGKKSNAGSTYNFSKNKVDPFSNLVSFKK